MRKNVSTNRHDIQNSQRHLTFLFLSCLISCLKKKKKTHVYHLICLFIKIPNYLHMLNIHTIQYNTIKTKVIK